MIKTFTEDDLVRYVYGETSIHENQEIENAVVCDSDLQELLNDLKSTVKMLDEMILSPSERALERVFKFAFDDCPVR